MKCIHREALWESNNYTSLSIKLPGNEDSDDEESEEEEEEEQGDGGLNYVVGDVTNPQHTGDKDAIVLHCVGE